MDRIISIAKLAVLASLIVWLVQSVAVSAPDAGLERPCIPEAGAATEVACTTGASASTALEPGEYFEASCDTDAYVRTGVGSATAAAGDFPYRAETTYYFGVGGTEGTNYFACKSVSTNGSCWLRECR